MKLREKIAFMTKNEFKAIIGFIVFMSLAFKVFCCTTYLFRNVGYDRNHIVGIENEKVDMVYIGGSAAFVYWEPLKAWNDCGFTSYLFATNTLQAENIKAYLEEAEKTQDSELYVVGVRAFEYYSDDQVEAGLRNGSDSMDITSCARYKLLKEYFNNRIITDDTDMLSYYLDIAKYHTNTGNLGLKKAWEFINNDGISLNKGWEWQDQYGYLDEPHGIETDIRAELPENCKKILIDLLDYCKREELNVLFVVCPYYLSMEAQQKYNAIGDIIEQYGFNYLNANEHYEEMNLDFSTDFYNKNHVNLFGAAKYTEFLENYILSNYNMPDHRGDNNYASWEDDYIRFCDEEKQHSETVTNLRLDVEKGIQMAEQMKTAKNLSEWYKLAEDSRYTLLITTGDSIYWPQNISDQKIMGTWELNIESRRQIRVVSGVDVLYSNEVEQTLVADGAIGPWGDILYHVSVEEPRSSILVNGEEVSLNQGDINVVVFDNNYRKVVDSIALQCEDDGGLHIYRE